MTHTSGHGSSAATDPSPQSALDVLSARDGYFRDDFEVFLDLAKCSDLSAEALRVLGERLRSGFLSPSQANELAPLVLQHVNAPEDLLLSFVEERWADTLLGRSDLTAALRQALLGSDDVLVRSTAVTSLVLSEAEQRELSADPSITTALVLNSGLTRETARAVAASALAEDRGCISGALEVLVSRDLLDLDLVAMMARHEDFRVRIAAARWQALTPELEQLLAEDREAKVARALAACAATPSVQRSLLRRDRCDQVLAGNPRLCAEVADVLVTSGGLAVLEALLANPGAPAPALRRAIKSCPPESWYHYSENQGFSLTPDLPAGFLAWAAPGLVEDLAQERGVDTGTLKDLLPMWDGSLEDLLASASELGPELPA
jgi:hypothetical protein